VLMLAYHTKVSFLLRLSFGGLIKAWGLQIDH
jgi:hypothetical protein